MRPSFFSLAKEWLRGKLRRCVRHDMFDALRVFWFAPAPLSKPLTARPALTLPALCVRAAASGWGPWRGPLCAGRQRCSPQYDDGGSFTVPHTVHHGPILWPCLRHVPFGSNMARWGRRKVNDMDIALREGRVRLARASCGGRNG